ncbi:MAG: hypothetical protein EOO02_10135 [Chitinophagaceae bacterium]|nr:MAG: hypothetical protein EOO02_10135 [Chitinophagaceae bacterium]
MLSVLGSASLSAQTYDSLQLLKGHKAKVYYSTGNTDRAKQIAVRCDNVLAYYKPVFGFEPEVTLLILSPADWPTYSAKGAVYGMPHYSGSQTLIIAGQDNAFWQSQVPPINKLPQEFASKFQATYTNQDNKLTMQGFFDLLAIHELGHAYHNQAKVKMQRRWMGELFPNILLHTYIAEKEPALLPALTLFPKMMIMRDTAGLRYTSLEDFESKYNEIAQKSPGNYGWYQCKLHAAAAMIYDTGGKDIVAKLWNALKGKNEVLGDTEFIALLSDKADQSIADVQLKWSAIK